MIVALVVPLAAYPVLAGAQSSTGAAPAASASATPASSPSTAPPSTVAAPARTGGMPEATRATATSATTLAPASVDMSSRSAEQGMNGATYAVRLRDLEQQVDELKDKVRRSHTRLALLSDTILGGGAAGSRSEVDFKNEMSSAFLLIRALIVIDGQAQYNRQDDSGALADQKEIPIFSGSMPPGDHTIQIALTFQGNGYGVFSYLRGYKFDVKSSHAFTAIEGKSLTITATAFEKGGVTTPLEQRPTIEWQEKLQAFTAGAPGAGQARGGAGAPAAAGAVSAPAAAPRGDKK